MAKKIRKNLSTTFLQNFSDYVLSSLNSVECEIGFRLEGLIFSVFFLKVIHILLPKIIILHFRSYGR